MKRVVALAMCAACAPPELTPPEPAPVFFVAPPPTLAGLGASRGRFGRGEAPSAPLPSGIRDSVSRIDSDGELGGVRALDLPGGAWLVGPRGVDVVDVDQGVWKRHAEVPGPIAAVVSGRVVIADDIEVRVANVDGTAVWGAARRLLVAGDDRLVVTGDTPIEVAILAVADGHELARVPLPARTTTADVTGVCGDAVVMHGSLIDPAGKAIESIGGVRSCWPARDGGGGFEVSTDDGMFRATRAFGDVERLDLPVLGELIASRGDRRLVRATPRTAVLLDGRGIAAFVGLTESTAVLGATHILAGSRRFAIPEDRRKHVRVPAIHAGITLDAELRDLPPVVPLDDATAASAGGDIAGLVLDGADVYAATSGALARGDTGSMSWRWTRPDGCPKDARAVAAAANIVCTGVTETIATTKEGAAAWTAKLGGAAVIAAGDVVVVSEGDRAHVLDAKTGAVLGELASDDGGPVPVALVVGIDSAGGTSGSGSGSGSGRDMPPPTWLLAALDGRLVAIAPHAAMTPAWSLTVDGVVTKLSASGQGVLVELEGGDAYRVTMDGAVSPVAAIGLVWHASDDVLAGLGAGGFIPPNPMPTPPPPPPPLPPGVLLYRMQNPSAFENLPPMSIPWDTPTDLRPSTQLALFAPAGGALLRNDYALATPVDLAPRTAGAPFVLLAGDGTALVVDAATGDPRKRVKLPEGGAVFAVRGVAGIVLPRPLRLVRF